MAKKKTRYPHRRAQIMRRTIISLFFLAVIGAGIYGINYLDKQSKSYIMTFDGEKISVEDYNYFRYILTMYQSEDSTTDTKSAALDELTNYLVINKAAKDKGIVLTAEEIESTAVNLEIYKSIMSSGNIPNLPAPNISDEHMKELMAAGTLYDKVRTELTKDYVIDEAAFKTYYDEYLATNKYSEIDAKIKFVITGTKEIGEQAREKLVAGTNIDDVIKEFSLYYDDQYDITSTDLKEFNFKEEILDQIVVLKPTEYTDVIDLIDGGFLIAYMDEINTLTKEEVEAAQREEFTANAKNEIFNTEFTKYKDAAAAVTNEKAYALYE